MALYDPEPQPVEVLTPAQALLAAAQADPAKFAARLVDGTVERVLNFVTLALYLRALPQSHAGFGMGTYFTAEGKDVNPKQVTGYECGTSACAVGHAIAAGVATQQKDYNWIDYGYRCFTPYYDDYIFAFGGHWGRVDDTPHGAAARICYLLANGSAGIRKLDHAVRFEQKVAFYQQYLA